MNAARAGDGLSILVVDDEAMIVMLLEDMLADLGCTVAGSAGSVAQSLAVIDRARQTLDGAFLDINLRGELVYPVADELKARGVPFVFVTGNAVHGIDPGYAGVPALSKPFGARAIEQAVQLFAERRQVPAKP
nr:response regulator [uncultured Rhodopila sp.]